MNDAESIPVLKNVLIETKQLVAGVSAESYDDPTPCADYPVGILLNHMIGWLQVFAAGANELVYEGDAAGFTAGADPAAEFGSAAESVIAGWEKFGLDRMVKTSSSEMPGNMVFGMTVMEYLAHAWDLAVATGQAVPFSDQEINFALDSGKQILPAEYRGEGMPFANEVEVPSDAPAIEQFVAFMGRNPDWKRPVT